MLATDDPVRREEFARTLREALNRIRLRLAQLVDEAAQEAGESLTAQQRAERVQALFDAEVHAASGAHHMHDRAYVEARQAAETRAREHLRAGDVEAALRELREFVARTDVAQPDLRQVARELTAERFRKGDAP